jgi:hypothetical protein
MISSVLCYDGLVQYAFCTSTDTETDLRVRDSEESTSLNHVQGCDIDHSEFRSSAFSSQSNVIAKEDCFESRMLVVAVQWQLVGCYAI